jgi:2-amino-4-hydroxy-6-hydroxymethyldihydropteridine diphosphokinase
MPPAYISLGSNINPEHYLPRAAAAVTRLGRITGVSNVYESEAVGPAGQPRFLNAVVRVEVPLSRDELRRRLREIEADLGRVRTQDAYAPRTIDLDLVALGEFVDPEVSRRAYLAVTLAEVDPDLPTGVGSETAASAADRLRVRAELRPRPDVDLHPGAAEGPGP